VRAIDISYVTNRDKLQAHFKFYDMSDNTMIGLAIYGEKQNGYQLINIYQTVDGKVKLVKSIDTEFMSTQCGEANAVTTVGSRNKTPNSAGSCFACMAACGLFAALGCGLGLISCVAAPWICAAIYVFCGAGFYTTCRDFCYSIHACP
jgi:hypothetical protein